MGLADLGTLHASNGDHRRAQPLFERALAIQEKAFGPDHPNVAMSVKNLADVHGLRGAP